MSIPEFVQLKNHFLLAMPDLHNSIFASSLTYLFEHSDEGAAGIIINKPLNFTLAEIFKQLELPTDAAKAKDSVLVGGPVSQEQGFVLHRHDTWGGSAKSTLCVSNDISVSTSLEVLQALAAGEGPQEALVTLGYAGWAAGQLEDELANNAWLTIEADIDILFNTPAAERAGLATQKLGFDINNLRSDIGHA